jgi:chromosome segregation ATPase
MIIREFTIKNFRKLVEPVLITGLQPGVNVIAGDNEEGKSTLLTALRCAFFMKHNSTGLQVENLLPYGSQVRPEVTVDFELDNEKYSLQKTFCLKPFVARLKTPAGLLEGSAVEEKLQELLLYPGAAGKKASEDKGFWGLLWLEQTAAINGLSMSEHGRQTIMKAVESDVGTVLGGRNGTRLMSAVSVLYSNHFTAAYGNPTKEYKKAQDLVAEVERELHNCKLAYREYESKVNDLIEKREEMAKLKRENALLKAKEREQLAQAEVQKMTVAQAEHASCAQTEKTLRAEAATLQQSWQSRVQLRLDLDNCHKQRDTIEQSISKDSAEQTAMRLSMEKAQAEYETVMKEIAEREQRKAELLAAERLQRLEQNRREMADRLDRAKLARVQYDKIINQFNAIRVDEKTLPGLRSLQRAAADAQARADAASTRITFSPQGENQARLSGQVIDTADVLLVHQDTSLELVNWGSIEIKPGGEDSAAKRLEATSLQGQFAAALKKAEVASIEEAEELAQSKQSLKNDAELLARELKLLVPAGIKALEADLAKVSQELESYPIKLPQAKQVHQEREQISRVDSPLTPENIAEELARLTTSLESLRKQEAAEQRSAAEWKKSVHQSELSVTQLTARLGATMQQISTLDEKLQRLSAEESDEALKARLDSALHKCATKEKEIEVLKAKLDALQPAVLKQELESAQKSLKQLELNLANLDRNIDILAAEIETLGKQGPGERLSEYEGKFEKAGQQLESIERKARAIKLLYETMKQCEQEAREQFMEPVQTRLRPYLNEVFPGSDLALDKSEFEIAGLLRNRVSEKYNSLSVGTREQISVLTRLAIAGLLKEKGYPVAVILDDALVYSDARRFDLMKSLLRRAAEERAIQIIILTCRRRDYEDMESSLISLADCAKAATPV